MRLIHVRHVLWGRPLQYLNLIIVLLAHKEIVVFLCREYRGFLFIVDDTATPLFHGVVVLLLHPCLDFLLSG
jgi:hypothetical protein